MAPHPRLQVTVQPGSLAESCCFAGFQFIPQKVKSGSSCGSHLAYNQHVVLVRRVVRVQDLPDDRQRASVMGSVGIRVITDKGDMVTTCLV